jgi:threonine/homoserine/homoserine lactone efflux protein
VTQVQWPLFIAASLVLIITPGQDMLLVMSRSIAQGARAGVMTAAGVSTGLVGHTFLSAVGLGALLRASEPLFLAVKFAGAAYLVYLGITMLRAGSAAFPVGRRPERALGRLFVDGVVSNISNPKITIFYFAFLPQFVDADATRPGLLVLVHGLTFAALTFVVKGPVGLSAGLLSEWLRARPAVQRWIQRCGGIVLIGLGVKLALERRG